MEVLAGRLGDVNRERDERSRALRRLLDPLQDLAPERRCRQRLRPGEPVLSRTYRARLLQQLAEQRRRNQQTPAQQRWEQETLRRQAEELAREMERLARETGSRELDTIRQRIEQAARDMQGRSQQQQGQPSQQGQQARGQQGQNGQGGQAHGDSQSRDSEQRVAEQRPRRGPPCSEPAPAFVDDLDATGPGEQRDEAHRLEQIAARPRDECHVELPAAQLAHIREPFHETSGAAGHCMPGVGLGLLPDEKVHQLRRLHGLPGHPHVETPFIQANTGSLGMGISKAKGMAIANRLLGKARRIVVLTGDGELQEGQFWESLGTAAHKKLYEIVAIVDHNKIQSDTWVDSVSRLGDLELKFHAFGWHVVRCDGHDVAALERTFRSLDAVVDRPKVIVADTVKGKGVSFMEGSLSFHGRPPTDEEYAKAMVELDEGIERAQDLVGVPA